MLDLVLYFLTSRTYFYFPLLYFPPPLPISGVPSPKFRWLFFENQNFEFGIRNFGSLLLVIPCYNHNKYLADLLKKIRKYYNDDILIIDDGSSCSIKIKQSNLDIIRNDINKGKGFSIIKAAKYAIDNKYSHIIFD